MKGRNFQRSPASCLTAPPMFPDQQHPPFDRKSQTALLLRLLSLAGIIFAIGVVVYLCAFKVFTIDFWWHVKAGEIMWKTRSLITTDPFSYTRVGQPYGGGYCWLSEIVFFLVFRLGGSTGIILLRTLLTIVTMGIILTIDRKMVWPKILPVLWGVYVMRTHLMDRPQLFSFLFTAIFLWGGCRYLTARIHGTVTASLRRRLLAGAVITEVLWANFHAGVGIIGLVVIGAVIMQILWEHFRSPAPSQARFPGDIRFLALVFLGAAAATFISPEPFRFITNLILTSTDRTFGLMNEWQPRSLPDYIATFGAFWVLALTTLAISRRQVLFSLSLLAATGILSVQMFRNGPFFILSAITVTTYQLGWTPYRRGVLKSAKTRLLMILGSILVMLGMTWYFRHHIRWELPSNLLGYGSFSSFEKAADYLDRAGLQGNMFNAGDAGSYLLYHGYPSRPVFYTGINFDFGYDFIRKMSDAGSDARAWKELEDRYGFTYAVLDYAEMRVDDSFGYSIHLHRNPSWRLVYVDDWAAVYAKDIPANRAVIKRDAYALITPERLSNESIFSDLPKKQWSAATEELKRVIAGDLRSIKARLILGRHLFEERNLPEALRLAEEAAKAQPYAPEAHELLGMIAAAEGRWSDAGTEFELAIDLNEGIGAPVNFAFLSQIFSQAGDPVKAAAYQRKAENQEMRGEQ